MTHARWFGRYALALSVFVLAGARPAVTAAQTSSTQDTASNRWHYASDLVTDADAPDGFARLLFADGKTKAFTISCDDGRIHDRRFVEILNRYGIRGTFNLNSSSLDKEGYVARAEIKTLYAGHEVACHTANHRSLTQLTDEDIRTEIMSNRMDLERLVGQPVRGLAYPSGDQDARVAALLPSLGLAYARCVGLSHWFALPKNPYLWITTCNLGDRWMDDAAMFAAQTNSPTIMLAWGHSYAFGQNDQWPLLEAFCKKIGGRNDVWYTTCIEVTDYMDAARRLHVSASGVLWRNPSAIPIWIAIAGRAVELNPGETVDVTAPQAKPTTPLPTP